MKSETLPTFWELYRKLDDRTRRQAQQSFRLWFENPFHPSLHFKVVNAHARVWSVRIGISYRALGTWDGETVTWYWIGSHDEYERIITSL